MELNAIKTNGNDASARSQGQDHGDGLARGTGVPEREALLSEQNNSVNGENTSYDDSAEAQRIMGNARAQIETSTCARIKKEMNAVLFSRVRLWMVAVAVVSLIVAVIIISLVICSVIHKDEDETFDRSSFTVPQYYRGSVQLPNLPFTEELSDLLSNESQQLAAKLKQQLNSLFETSPALGRYFFKAEISSFSRNGSVIADYRLEFRLPEDDQDELKRFPLSRGTVFNVFRQFLYDQDRAESESVYIDPVSLSMV